MTKKVEGREEYKKWWTTTAFKIAISGIMLSFIGNVVITKYIQSQTPNNTKNIDSRFVSLGDTVNLLNPGVSMVLTAMLFREQAVDSLIFGVRIGFADTLKNKFTKPIDWELYSPNRINEQLLQINNQERKVTEGFLKHYGVKL